MISVGEYCNGKLNFDLKLSEMVVEIMKALVSLWVSFVMLFVSFVPGFVQPEVQSGQNTESYPYIFVHGLFGWGEDEGINNTLSYWGATSCHLINNLRKEGYDCYDTSVGPMNSNWDRACELYAQLTGTRVDYGLAHSQEHNHGRYGRLYTEPLIPGWGEKDNKGNINKINLIGHSFGGNTVRLLLALLDEGSPEEISSTPSGDISPLFTGGHGNWVNALVTVCSPNNGSTLAYILDETGLKEFFMTLIYAYAGVMGRSPLNGYVDFHMEQFGLTNVPGQEITDDMIYKAIKLIMEQKYDNVAYDLSPEGALALNNSIGICSDTYYFSYAFTTTTKSKLTGTYFGIPSTLAILRPFAAMMGSYPENRMTDYPINEDWLENDGLVNLISAKYPFDDPHTEYNYRIIGRGCWNVMPVSTGDHGNAIGIGTSEEQTMEFYNGMLKMIDSLPAD